MSAMKQAKLVQCKSTARSLNRIAVASFWATESESQIRARSGFQRGERFASIGRINWLYLGVILLIFVFVWPF